MTDLRAKSNPPLDQVRSLGQLLVRRRDFGQLVLLGSVVALAINIIASALWQYIAAMFTASGQGIPYISVAIGALMFIGLASLVVAQLWLGRREIDTSVSAVIVADGTTGSPVVIDVYKVSVRSSHVEFLI